MCVCVLACTHMCICKRREQEMNSVNVDTDYTRACTVQNTLILITFMNDVFEYKSHFKRPC